MSVHVCVRKRDREKDKKEGERERGEWRGSRREREILTKMQVSDSIGRGGKHFGSQICLGE